MGWAGLGPAPLATGPNQWPGKINCTARVKQFHACSNYVKVIKLPSHSSSFAQLKQEWRENENGLPTSGGREEACRTAILFSSVYACSFCFPFVSVMMKVTACCSGSSFLWFAGGIEETVLLSWFFLGFFVCVFSVFLCIFFLCFALFSPCLALSVFFFFFGWGRLCSAFIEPAATSVVVTAASSPKCSVTDALNEENVRHVCQRTKRLCL
jgi:hypothetical protein